jgi:hypothetical protein
MGVCKGGGQMQSQLRAARVKVHIMCSMLAASFAGTHKVADWMGSKLAPSRK